jgi:hypothetical protein
VVGQVRAPAALPERLLRDRVAEQHDRRPHRCPCRPRNVYCTCSCRPGSDTNLIDDFELEYVPC